MYSGLKNLPAERMGSNAVALLIAAAVAWFHGLTVVAQEKAIMTILLNTPEAREYETLEIPVEPLRLAEGSGAATTITSPSPDYCAKYANYERNGRVDIVLPEGEWSLAWEHDIRKGALPEAVLSADDRIVVHSGVWQLFDLEGTLIKEGSIGPSSVSLDSARGHFYHMNRTGDIVGRNLSDGEEPFTILPFLGSEFSRPLIRAYGEQLLLIGIERQLDPHGHKKASRSLIEWIELGASRELSGTGLLVSAKNAGTLIFPTTALLSAAGSDGVVCAAPDHLYFSKLAPKLDGAYGASFVPSQLSLGGNSRVYLSVWTEDEARLWILSTDGAWLTSMAFPEGVGTLIAPPIVGPDGGLYLASASSLTALSPSGEVLWSWKPAAPLVGATCTGNGTVAVTTQRELGLVGPDGTYTRLHRNVDSPIHTAPCVTKDGALVIATTSQIQAFRAQ